MPPIAAAPLLPTWYWNVVWPAENTALPETEMLVNDGVAVGARDHVAEVAAPADLDAFRAERLPGRLLVVVGGGATGLAREALNGDMVGLLYFWIR